MDKNANIVLAVIKKVCDKFPETQEFSNKIYVEECCKENISVEEVFFNINNFSLRYYASLWFVTKYIIFSCIFEAQDLYNKKKVKKSMEEIKKEKLESIVKESLGDLELFNKAYNGLIFQDPLECVKQYEKHLQNEKIKIINIAYKQGQFLHQFRECE